MKDTIVISEKDNDENSSTYSEDEINLTNSITSILTDIKKLSGNKKQNNGDEINSDDEINENDDSDDDLSANNESDEDDEDEDEDEDEDDDEDDDEDEDEDENEIFDSIGVTNEGLAAMFQGVFIDSNGITIADSLSLIAKELHKLNHNLKKKSSK